MLPNGRSVPSPAEKELDPEMNWLQKRDPFPGPLSACCFFLHEFSGFILFFFAGQGPRPFLNTLKIQ
jgi:hypothetical protein